MRLTHERGALKADRVVPELACIVDESFDKCATDEEHLLNTKIPPGEDRPRCRVLVEDLLPAGAVGQKGTWIIRTQMWMPDFPDYVPAEEDDGG